MGLRAVCLLGLIMPLSLAETHNIPQIHPPYPLMRMSPRLTPERIASACSDGANVSIALNDLQYFVRPLPDTQCVEIITTGSLSSASCSLPPHCGSSKYTQINSGWFSSLGRCEGLGFTNTTTAGNLQWSNGWKGVFNVTITGIHEELETHISVIFDYDKLEYTLYPTDFIGTSFVILNFQNELRFPPLHQTTDSRYCRTRVQTSHSLQPLTCTSSSLQQLPCKCNLPAYTSKQEYPTPSDTKLLFRHEYAYQYIQIPENPPVPPHGEIRFFGVDRGLYTVCPAYSMTTSITTQYLKGIGSALAHASLAVLATLWSYVSRVVDEVVDRVISPQLSSSMVYAGFTTWYLVSRQALPHIYTIIFIYIFLTTLYSFIISHIRQLV